MTNDCCLHLVHRVIIRSSFVAKIQPLLLELEEHLDLNIPDQKGMIELTLQLCAVDHYKKAFRT